MSAAPTTSTRIALGLSALGALALGIVAVVGLEIASEESAPTSGLRGEAFGLIPLAVVVALLATGALFGLAIVPARVVESGRRATFAAATALLVLAVVFAIPSPLALFTWPIAALTALGSMLLFRRAFRPKP